MKDTDVGRNLWHGHTSLVPFFLNGSLTCAGTPRYLSHSDICTGGTWNEKGQRQDEEGRMLHTDVAKAYSTCCHSGLGVGPFWEVPFRNCCIFVAVKSFEHVLWAAVLFLAETVFPHTNHLIYSTIYITPCLFSGIIYQNKRRHLLRSPSYNNLLSKHNKIYTLIVDCDTGYKL